ncbi:gp53-like domain-containing protein [Burkholderia ambifaria]|uniref:gp53-like domain-containing protein n=1 Tax=Burkholderia ambifaria TaxID=152480 RepID=UPI001FC8E841|nr:hypothetical protein [Burkholderia ambifaria]
MTNLIEIERWEDGVYQLETSDPVVGGPDGIDNLQAKQLANRTRYLKRAIESGQSNLDAHTAAVDPHPQYATHADLAEKVAALVAQSPETLDTLSELAKALGNDPNFATTITNQLALKAPINSPVLTGAPKASAPTQFDNTTRIATTSFVQGIGQQIPWLQLTGASALTAAQAAGKLIYLLGASSYVTTLPAASSMPAGTTISFLNTSGAVMTVACAGNDTIGLNNPTTAASAALGNGDTMTLVAMADEGNRAWQCVAGSILMGFQNVFGSVLGGNGYQKLPGGLILQWATGGSDSLGNLTVANPIAFQSAVLGGIANEASPVGWGNSATTVWGFDLVNSTKSTSVARVRSISGSGGPSVASGAAGRIVVWGY